MLELADTLVAASTANDLRAVQRFVRKPVVTAGLWFADPTCAPFSAATTVAAPRLPELARGLAGLHLQRAPRIDPLDDVVVLTYAPGIELEARFLEDAEGPYLAWIGYEARRDLADGLPTISAALLESARITGARDGDVDATTGAALLAYAKRFDADSQYAASARAWTFHPIAIDGHAIPACAMVRMDYPAAKHPAQEKLPLVLPDTTADVIYVPHEVLGPRTAGVRAVQPDEDTARVIFKLGVRELEGAYGYCLDDSGAVDSVLMVRSTGVPAYDATLAAGVRAWHFAPYAEPAAKGERHRVCSSVSFIYKAR